MVALATEPVTTKPRYRYTDANGAHLHELDTGNGWQPLLGTSTVAGASDSKPGLIWFGATESALVCLEAGTHIPTIRAEYAEVNKLTGYPKKKALDALQLKYPILKKARYAHKSTRDKAADPGTEMHLALSRYVLDCIADNMGEPCKLDKYGHGAVEVFSDWACENVKEFLWSERHCFSHTLWVGGICDVGMVLNDGKTAVGDFKSAKEAYCGQFVQCGGYAYQIEQNGLFNADGDKVGKVGSVDALIVFPFGSDVGPQVRYDAREAKFCFFCATHIYKFQRKFDV